MNSMHNIDEQTRQARVYAQAMESLQAHNRVYRPSATVADMRANQTPDGGTPLLDWAGGLSAKFCIAFAFITPCYMFWSQVLN
ncbi:MAG: hypothetical protein ACPG6L_02190 [Nereida ignava]|jgi:hypothetical protein|uniref:hypothetical protein n=1 Tax=Nereida TaxID=282198 RepID=UPI0030F87FC2